jgi:hypothetical protein
MSKRTLFLTVLEFSQSLIKVTADLVSGEGSMDGTLFLHCNVAERTTSFLAYLLSGH